MLILLAACSDDATVSLGGDGPTWHADVAPVVAARCGSCHTAGGIAPFAFDTWEEAAALAPAMAAATASGSMPPWGAVETDECAPRYGWKDDARLTDDEKALFAAWADAGAPEGDPAEASEVEPARGELADADAELVPATPYVTSGKDDEFVCFSLDPGLTERAWVTGVEVVPDDLSVVHHVVVYSDPNGESAALAGEDGLYDCFGDADVSDAMVLGVWVPGAFPTSPPEGSGFPVEAGSRVVLQMHYHPAGSAGAPDATGVRLAWTSERPEKTALLTGWGNAWDEGSGLLPGPNDRDAAEFRIPADVAGHTETMTFDFGDVGGRYAVWAMEAHMHMVGVDMLATVEHRDPDVGVAEECLIHEPAWDFDWQRLYTYDAPLGEVSLGDDDVLTLRCTYDNTLANPGVARALDDAGLDEPEDVYLGESSYDEMCILIFGIVY
ncbi:MAG: hypothetical protein ACOZNI_25665 [Myxococcota bacterium]